MADIKVYAIPSLPVDKDYHIFVCYSRGDLENVHILIENLEKEGLKCLYHERDFTAGHSILTNMLDKIRKSMYMLVVLSEDFVNSGYAKHEVAEAMHLQISEGYSIIPLLIEPCTVPDFLKHITYIDVTEVEVSEIHKRVLETVVNHKTMTDLQESITGKCIACHVQRSRKNRLSCAIQEFKLIFNESDRARIADFRFQFSDKELAKIATTVSNSTLVRFWHVYTNFKLCACIICFIMNILYALIHTILMLTIFDQSKPVPNDGSILQVLLIVIPMVLWVCCGTLAGIEAPVFQKRISLTYNLQIKAKKLLMLELNKFNLEARKNNQIIILSHSLSNVCLILMRYDFRPCQTYFIKRCDRKEVLRKHQRAGESVVEYTNRLFDSFVQSSDVTLLIEPSPQQQKRHRMENNAKCICLIVEEMLCK
ncbi:hypothetical protein DPMN_004774 [Dreissena polymorpha]|uniref:TIR domain-containing protein n=1 Tax=Dreissena polymorpha TaxID=45954 RepID=A0A9D4MNE7_DREPO|nr:hypothetical protein DPMN_004774 [Dreissena polymorpha]